MGFVTFNTRAGAEAAKQDLQVGTTTTLQRQTYAAIQTLFLSLLYTLSLCICSLSIFPVSLCNILPCRMHSPAPCVTRRQPVLPRAFRSNPYPYYHPPTFYHLFYINSYKILAKLVPYWLGLNYLI